ncbi:MAG: RNA-binding S4 domain-containing protein [Dysgonamonadaceae bacterium]|jgi:23S rRNA pseudouridine2605 synthase|nr:RNA-binding S4 domain-containing protein [Dysgonamonadaceae bacterium]
MTTERDEWRPRNNYERRSDEGQNRERRPYQQNYGNEERSYNRPYNNQGGNYERRQGGYGNYSKPGGNYSRPGGNYSRSEGGNYERRENTYNTGRPQRSYDNAPRQSYGNSYNTNPEGDDGTVKKRRARIGDTVQQPRVSGYGYGDRQQGGYGNRQQGGYGNRQQGGYGNRQQGNNFGNRRPQGDQRSFQRREGDYNPNAKYSFQKQLKYREEHFDPNEPIRLNKYLANAGVCSRREADEFIQAGVVKVNGEVTTELGTKVKRADQVMFHDQPIQLEHKIYVLLNKPKNCVTTADDPQERLTVMDLVKNACRERIFPVGRLDRNTTGVLLLTNDGDLASKLTHPKFLKKKIYHVWLDKDVQIEDMQKLADGIELEDGEIHADAISYVSETDKDQVGIEIHSGRNRIVRRMFESLGYHVTKLDRVYFAGLTKKNLKRGQWRYLNEREVNMLRMGAFD